jgi:hypothetical protein
MLAVVRPPRRGAARGALDVVQDQGSSRALQPRIVYVGVGQIRLGDRAPDLTVCSRVRDGEPLRRVEHLPRSQFHCRRVIIGLHASSS